MVTIMIPSLMLFFIISLLFSQCINRIGLAFNALNPKILKKTIIFEFHNLPNYLKLLILQKS